MQQKFISNLILMVVLNLLVKPAAIFGIDAEIQNRVAPEDYGMYFSLLNFSFLFNILMDFGINNFTTKSVAQYPNAAVTYLGKVISLRVALFLLYAAITLSMGFVIGWRNVELSILIFLVINQLFVTLIAYARSHFGGLLMFRTEAFISVLDRFLLILFCGALLYFPLTDVPFKIEWFVWIQTLCYGITFLVAFTILLKKIGLPKIKHNQLFSYAIIKRSFPYALLILLMMIYTRIDSVMIERLHIAGKSEAGVYAQGFRILDAFFMLAMIFSNLLFPIFSKMFSEKSNIVDLLTTSGKLLIGGAFGVSIITYFHADLILGWIYDDFGISSIYSFQLLMFAFVGMCSSLIFGTLLTANGSLRFLNSTALAGIVVNSCLNYYLIPIYGATGAAFATLCTQLTVSLIQLFYCLSYFNLRPKGRIVLQFVGFIGTMILIGLYVPVYSNGWFFVVVALIGISLFVFRLIDLKQLKANLLTPDKKEI